MTETAQTHCSLVKHLRIRTGTMKDYQTLCRFHYRSSRLGPIGGVWVLCDEHPARRPFCPVVGVIVYTHPVPYVSVRNVVTGGFFTAPATITQRLSLLNKYMRCISRVVIEPRWRGLGLAGELVRQTLPLAGVSMVESMAIMGRWTGFFQRGGMKCYRVPPGRHAEQLSAAMEMVGIDRSFWVNGGFCKDRIDGLDRPGADFIKNQIKIFCRAMRMHDWDGGAAGLENVLGGLSDRWNYYIWMNPSRPTPGLLIADDKEGDVYAD